MCDLDKVYAAYSDWPAPGEGHFYYRLMTVSEALLRNRSYAEKAVTFRYTLLRVPFEDLYYEWNEEALTFDPKGV